jgi:hypothetical protein
MPLYSQLAQDIANEAWTINPVFISQIGAYDAQKIKVTSITGVPVPMIYDITPKG